MFKIVDIFDKHDKICDKLHVTNFILSEILINQLDSINRDIWS